jgi:hypothetical protein
MHATRYNVGVFCMHHLWVVEPCGARGQLGGGQEADERLDVRLRVCDDFHFAQARGFERLAPRLERLCARLFLGMPM